MNRLAAKAELAVRGCRWGEGIGGVEAKDQDFVKFHEMMYYELSEEFAVRQEKFGKKLTKRLSVPA